MALVVADRRPRTDPRVGGSPGIVAAKRQNAEPAALTTVSGDSRRERCRLDARGRFDASDRAYGGAGRGVFLPAG
jgi:hypothetical protein